MYEEIKKQNNHHVCKLRGFEITHLCVEYLICLEFNLQVYVFKPFYFFFVTYQCPMKEQIYCVLIFLLFNLTTPKQKFIIKVVTC